MGITQVREAGKRLRKAKALVFAAAKRIEAAELKHHVALKEATEARKAYEFAVLCAKFPPGWTDKK